MIVDDMPMHNGAPRFSKRWSMKKDGKTFIVYSSSPPVLPNGFTDLKHCGYYDRRDNVIICDDPEDQVTLQEGRIAPGA